VARIFLVGCSGHANVVLDIVEKEGRYKVAGIIDSFAVPETQILGLTVLGTESDLPRLIDEQDCAAALVAIGDNFSRQQMVNRIRSVAPQLEFVKAVHPSAQIARNVSVGIGTVVMAGAVINSATRVGEHCIVNTKASIDHDNTWANFSSIAPGATTGGNVTVGECAAISLQAGIVHGRRIGAHSVVGAGAIVLNDIPDFVVAYGTPARVIRTRTAGERYL
jgi:sugar O-acyltransferase (sialic acid O-acetyltransferase NeuD family)